jgi:F-type H+-transporting ATPase subunit b
MPQLDPTWFASQIFWLAVTFLALYFILSRLVLPPLQDTILRRQDKIVGDIETAQKLNDQANAVRIEYDRMIADAQNRAQQLITDGLAENKARAEQAGRDMDQQIERKVSEAMKKITAKKQELMTALVPATGELTALIVQKLTHKDADRDSILRAIGTASKTDGRS